jgi:hypothetical protein
MPRLTSKQVRILEFLQANPGWSTRAEMEVATGRKWLGYVERRDDSQPFAYRITDRGKRALSINEYDERNLSASNRLVPGYPDRLPEHIETFIVEMNRYGFEFYVTDPASKTINIRREVRERWGYINDTVKTKVKNGIFGYNFASFGKNTNSCPAKLVPLMPKLFSERYNCQERDFDFSEGTGANRGNWYLVITEPELAKRVLLRDAGISPFESKQIELPADEADDEMQDDRPAYDPEDGDQREVIKALIKSRRGQRPFRDALRRRYGNRCLVTGCKVLDVLEAAHIRPYRGDNDNNPQNGLLLRADIHTLFDLNLFGIEPDELRVELHPALATDEHYKTLAGRKLLCKPHRGPSADALKLRYDEFRNGLPS